MEEKNNNNNYNYNKIISYVYSFFEEANNIKMFYPLYFIRKGNFIHYGQYIHGFMEEKGKIKISNNDDLKIIYGQIKEMFSNDFVEGFEHTFGEGWSLLVTIGENIFINIDSDNLDDKNWFYSEAHKENKSSSKKV